MSHDNDLPHVFIMCHINGLNWFKELKWIFNIPRSKIQIWAASSEQNVWEKLLDRYYNWLSGVNRSLKIVDVRTSPPSPPPVSAFRQQALHWTPSLTAIADVISGSSLRAYSERGNDTADCVRVWEIRTSHARRRFYYRFDEILKLDFRSFWALKAAESTWNEVQVIF